jgi:hypothetical protein
MEEQLSEGGEGAQLWSAANPCSTPFDLATLQAAVAAVYRHTEPDPCKLGQHVVSPKALTRPGRYRCVNCGSVLDIPYPLLEHC